MEGTVRNRIKRLLFLFASLAVIGYSIPCSGLTVEEIIRLKNAGVSDRTIQLMLDDERQCVREYSDESGNTRIRYSTRPPSDATARSREEEEEVNRAWELLDRMIIDGRREK